MERVTTTDTNVWSDCEGAGRLEENSNSIPTHSIYSEYIIRMKLMKNECN